MNQLVGVAYIHNEKVGDTEIVRNQVSHHVIDAPWKSELIKQYKPFTEPMAPMQKLADITQALHLLSFKLKQSLEPFISDEKAKGTVGELSSLRTVVEEEIINKEALPDGHEKVQAAAVNSYSWSGSQKDIRFPSVNSLVNAEDPLAATKDFLKEFSHNIFAMIQAAYEFARDFFHETLSRLVDRLNTRTQLATDIGKYATYYGKQVADLSKRKEEERYTWKDGTDENPGPERRKMQELIAFMKRNNLRIAVGEENFTLEDWLKTKENGGQAGKEGELDLSELQYLNRTLEASVQTEGNLNSQIQTTISSGLQHFTNSQDGVVAVISKQFSTLQYSIRNMAN